VINNDEGKKAVPDDLLIPFAKYSSPRLEGLSDQHFK
jgi:hypothetical protein